MAEMFEVLEDGAENLKKNIKKKPFAVAAVGVGVLALFVWWMKGRNGSGDTTAYEAIGYGGYPTVAGGGGSSDSGDSYYDEIIRENQSQTDSILNSIIEENNAYLAEMESTIGILQDRVTTSEERESEYLKQIQRQQVISQMRANSELYNTITDRDTKDALHAENMSLAEEMGWTFDPSTGNYYEGNSVVYTTAKQQIGQNTAYTGGKVSTAPSGSFVNNQTYNQSVIDSILKANQTGGYVDGVDYSALYDEAAKAGAGSVVLNAIGEGRRNKVNSEYEGVDPNPSSNAAKDLYQKDGKTYTTASDGKPIEVTGTTHSGDKLSTKMPSNTRDTSRAGQTVTSMGYEITYNERGYVESKKKVK